MPTTRSNGASEHPSPLSAGAIAEIVKRHLSDIVVITDAELAQSGPHIVYVNDRFTEVTGYRPEEVIGRSPRFLQGAETDKRALRRLRRALQKGESASETIVNYARDGSRYDLEMRVAPVREGGTVTYFVAVQREVTRERQSQALMEELLSSVVNAFAFGMLVHDEAGRCVIANPALLALLDEPPHAVIGSFVDKLLPGIDPACLAAGGEFATRTIRLAAAANETSVTVERMSASAGAGRFTVLRVVRTASEAGRSMGANPSPAQVVAGRMQLVGLDDIRRRLGSRWPERRETILELAQGVLRRRLGSKDIWRRSENGDFVVIFAEEDERLARFKAAAIADEIRQLLIGDGETHVRLTSATAAVDVEGVPVDLGDDSILAHITRSIEALNADLESRVQRRLKESLNDLALVTDDVYLVRRGSAFAGRLRFDHELESDIMELRQAVADPSQPLLEVQCFVMQQAVNALSQQSGDHLRPLLVPFDPAVTDSRRSWFEMLEVARRIPTPLRKRMLPLIEGIRPQDGTYRISDMAVTLGQIFGHAGLVHPASGPLCFMPDRCRIRAVFFSAKDLPTAPEERKRLARLLAEVRLTRAQIGIDMHGMIRPTKAGLPPHDLLIVPTG